MLLDITCLVVAQMLSPSFRSGLHPPCTELYITDVRKNQDHFTVFLKHKCSWDCNFMHQLFQISEMKITWSLPSLKRTIAFEFPTIPFVIISVSILLLLISNPRFISHFSFLRFSSITMKRILNLSHVLIFKWSFSSALNLTLLRAYFYSFLNFLACDIFDIFYFTPLPGF